MTNPPRQPGTPGGNEQLAVPGATPNVPQQRPHVPGTPLTPEERLRAQTGAHQILEQAERVAGTRHRIANTILGVLGWTKPRASGIDRSEASVQRLEKAADRIGRISGGADIADATLGNVPYIGTVVGIAPTIYTVAEALRAGVPGRDLLKILTVYGTDLCLDLIPIPGVSAATSALWPANILAAEVVAVRAAAERAAYDLRNGPIPELPQLPSPPLELMSADEQAGDANRDRWQTSDSPPQPDVPTIPSPSRIPTEPDVPTQRSAVGIVDYESLLDDPELETALGGGAPGERREVS
ncbi:MAG: DUF4112 domain-containing protein [Patescibacteria group bacterium]